MQETGCTGGWNMKDPNCMPCQGLSMALMLILVFSPAVYGQDLQASPATSANPAPSAQGQQADSNSQSISDSQSTSTPTQPDASNLPDSPGSLQANPADASTQPQSRQSTPTAQAQTGQQPDTQQEPLGTAAAQSVSTSGNAASRPAGAALAPAKQRRTRSLLIKVGALVGVGVAVGTAMALSQGSPSKPPGAK